MFDKNINPEREDIDPMTLISPTNQNGLWFITFVLLSFLIFLTQISKSLTKSGKMLRKFSGPKPVPIIGNLILFAGSQENIIPTFGRLVDKYGKRILIWMANAPHIIIDDSKDAELVLSCAKHHKSKFTQIAMKWIMGDGLLISADELWKLDRKLLNPAFKYQQFDGFLDTFNKHGKTFVNTIIEEGTETEKNLHPAIVMCTIDSVIESTFGVPSDLQRNPRPKIIKNLHSVLDSMRTRILKPYLLIPVIWELFGCGNQERESISVAKEFFQEILAQRNLLAESGELGNEKSKPLMDVLMDHRSDQNIFDHMMNIFGAGFETVATGVHFTLYLLACHPEHQARVHKELDNVFADDQNTSLTFANLAEIKYLEMVIKEALRIYPPVPMTGRTLKCDVQLDDGLVIPEGTEILIDIYHIHRNPKVYPDPEKFDPERFRPEVCATRKLADYLPFSSGPRICIGQKYGLLQMKVMISHILVNFSVSTSLNRDELKPLSGLVLEPNVPILLKLTRRV